MKFLQICHAIYWLVQIITSSELSVCMLSWISLGSHFVQSDRNCYFIYLIHAVYLDFCETENFYFLERKKSATCLIVIHIIIKHVLNIILLFKDLIDSFEKPVFLSCLTQVSFYSCIQGFDMFPYFGGRFALICCQILRHIYDFLNQRCFLRHRKMKWKGMKLGVFMEPCW